MTDEEILVVSDRHRDLDSKPRLNAKNYLNIIFFILNILVTYGIGIAGWAGTPTNAELSDKYQTLVSPASVAFSIWGIVFIFQGIFSILQLFPSYGLRPMVQQGVSYWYIAVCVFQCAWTLAFAYEQITLSLVFMLLIWISLMGLLISQYYVELEPSTLSCTSMKGLLEFWLLRFPFAIHGGWITAASAVNVGLVAQATNAAPATQLSVAIICLAVLHALSVWHLFGYKRPNYTIPGVLIWANSWIYDELQNPKQSITETYDQITITGVSYAAFSVAMVIIIQIIVRVAFFVFNYLRGKSYLHEKLEGEE